MGGEGGGAEGFGAIVTSWEGRRGISVVLFSSCLSRRAGGGKGCCDPMVAARQRMLKMPKKRWRLKKKEGEREKAMSINPCLPSLASSEKEREKNTLMRLRCR